MRQDTASHVRCILWIVCCLCTLLPPASAFARAPATPVRQPTSGFQGEIVYVLEGNLWLHDLASGATRQLTEDGGYLLPGWSPDGRQLVASRGADLESADLVLLDTDGGEPRLLVEQACCGAWSPDGTQIAYVDLSADEPALRAIAPASEERTTLLAPLTYGRGAYPMGRLDWFNAENVLAPLEVIDDDSLLVYRDLFVVALRSRTVENLSGQGQAGCAVLSGDANAQMLAFDYEQRDGVCNDVPAPKGVGFAEGSNQAFPWLAAPSLSVDGVFMAAERFIESDLPEEAARWGVVAVNTLTGAEIAVAEGASQPAWRPAAPIDSAALRFVQDGEQVVTLEPPLFDEGVLYRISYLTTGAVLHRDGALLHLATTPDFWAKQGITALLVTGDGRLITDAETLQRVLERYHAAYHLYEAALPDFLPLLGDELDKVLKNPLLPAMSPGPFLTSARSQYAAALRAMLVAQPDAHPLHVLLDEAIRTNTGNGAAALDALGVIIEDQQRTNEALTAMYADLKLIYKSGQETISSSTVLLKMLRLAGDLLAMQELSQERAGWLQTYIERFPSGAAGFSRDPLRAAATVLNEVEEERLQRANLVLEFLGNETLQKLLADAGKLTAEQATALTADLAARYGFSISTQAVASVLSALSVGLTVNSILYGTDDLVANFQLAQRAEELRTAFQAGRALIQAEAAERAEDGYDGDLAVAYRTAVLLDTLAGATAYHAYAEGVAASQRIPNLLTLLNQLREEDWKEAAEGLHTAATNAEAAIVQDLANTAPLAAAVQLALERTTEDLFVEPVTGMVFVPVPAGEFEMGSTEEEVDAALALCNASRGNCERGWFADEQPQHTVSLDAYWIGQTEVTNAQFQQFVDAGGYAAERYWSAEGWQVRSDEGWGGPRCLEDENFNAPDQPVVCVSWYEAEAYTRWLSEASGAAIRLPTEAEWEKAARGTDGRIFPWGDEFDGNRLNFCDVNCEYDWKDETYDDGYTYTAPVGSYPEGASPYGALDMAGNVWEWVNDWYQEDYYSQSPGSNPQGPATGESRVLRGGSWYRDDYLVRSARRDYVFPGLWIGDVGFRCVRSL